MKSYPRDARVSGFTTAHHIKPLVCFLSVFLCSIHISSSEDSSFKKHETLTEGHPHYFIHTQKLFETEIDSNQTDGENASVLSSIDKGQATHFVKSVQLGSLISPVNYCCSREKKLQNIGVDITGNNQYVDVGHCRRICKSWPSLTENLEFNNDDLFNSSIPIKEHGNNIEERSSCGLNWQCEPSRVKVERHYLLSGATDVEIIEDCHCAKKSRNCERKSRVVVLFAGSFYETKKDVGICQGHCSKGPPRAVCISVIEKCDCTEECYRMHYFDSFTDEIWDPTSNSTIKDTRILDVGRCVGSCSGRSEHQCVLRHSTDSKKCLMSLSNRSSQCVPSSFNTHQFSARNGKIKQVLTISECGCK